MIASIFLPTGKNLVFFIFPINQWIRYSGHFATPNDSDPLHFLFFRSQTRRAQYSKIIRQATTETSSRVVKLSIKVLVARDSPVSCSTFINFLWFSAWNRNYGDSEKNIYNQKPLDLSDRFPSHGTFGCCGECCTSWETCSAFGPEIMREEPQQRSIYVLLWSRWFSWRWLLQLSSRRLQNRNRRQVLS